MPWKFILTIIILILVVIFAGVNIHPVKISFGFTEINEVPMFVCLLSSFALGTIISVPIVLMSKKKKQKKVSPKKGIITESIPSTINNNNEGNQIVTKGKNA